MHALPSQVLYISENWLSWRQFDLASLQCSPGKAMISLTIMSMISLLFKTQHLETMWQYFRKQMTWKKLMAWLTSSLSSGLETALCTLCIPQALSPPRVPTSKRSCTFFNTWPSWRCCTECWDQLGPVGASWGEMEVQFVVDFVDLMLPCDWNGKMKQSRTTSHYRSRYGSHYEPVLGASSKPNAQQVQPWK